MIDPEDERRVLDLASVPEHSVGLMRAVSGAEPYLCDDYLCFHKPNWLVVVGYPLERSFQADDLAAVCSVLRRRFKPSRVSVIAPELPPHLLDSCSEQERDSYYTLSCTGTRLPQRLLRIAEKCRETLRIEAGREFGSAHRHLTDEFLGRVNPPERICRLFRKMEAFVAEEANAVVLSAWDHDGNISAFYVLDLAPTRFSTYVAGCHSKVHMVSGASDALFHKMIEVGRDAGKEYIHLGLGVNEGIRRFKKKWGGKPTLDYRSCESLSLSERIRSAVTAFVRAQSGR